MYSQNFFAFFSSFFLTFSSAVQSWLCIPNCRHCHSLGLTRAVFAVAAAVASAAFFRDLWALWPSTACCLAHFARKGKSESVCDCVALTTLHRQLKLVWRAARHTHIHTAQESLLLLPVVYHCCQQQLVGVRTQRGCGLP